MVSNMVFFPILSQWSRGGIFYFLMDTMRIGCERIKIISITYACFRQPTSERLRNGQNYFFGYVWVIVCILNGYVNWQSCKGSWDQNLRSPLFVANCEWYNKMDSCFQHWLKPTVTQHVWLNLYLHSIWEEENKQFKHLTWREEKASLIGRLTRRENDR